MKSRSIRLMIFILVLSFSSFCFAESDAEIVIAARSGSYAQIERLIKQGVDVNAKDQYGNTALHFSVFNEDMEQVKLLIEAGADTTAKNSNGDTPLDIARGIQNQELVDFLISKGADKK